MATRRPRRVSRARKTVPMPPAPSSRISSYWWMRTPGRGSAVVAWTPVDDSHEPVPSLPTGVLIDGDGCGVAAGTAPGRATTVDAWAGADDGPRETAPEPTGATWATMVRADGPLMPGAWPLPSS